MGDFLIGLVVGSILAFIIFALSSVNKIIIDRCDYEKINDAIEKQIPKKPIIKTFENIDEETSKKFYPQFYLCAECGGLIGAKHNEYCSKCGQALDWSDAE